MERILIWKCPGTAPRERARGEFQSSRVSAEIDSTVSRYMFLTYPSAETATHALRSLDQLLFGKNRLYVNRFGEIERYASLTIEEGDTPKNWPADTQPSDKVSSRSPHHVIQLTGTLRNTSGHGSRTRQDETSSPRSETPLSKSTGAAETPLPNAPLSPTPSGQNSSSPGRRWEPTLPPCTVWVSPSGKASLSRNRTDSPTRASDSSISRRAKTTSSRSRPSPSSPTSRPILMPRRILDDSHPRTKETTLLCGKSRRVCFCELSPARHRRLRRPPV